MKITIKVLNGKDCTLDVEPAASILSVKQQIEAQLNIPVLLQKVLFMGRTLNDDNTIESYRIKEGSKLNLILTQKPELRDVMYKSFRKHYSEAIAEKIANNFVLIFNTKLKKMSLDDLERLASSELTTQQHISINE